MDSGQHACFAEVFVLRRQFQLHVFFFDHSWHRHHAQIVGGKDWFGIAHAEGFESPQSLKQVVADLIEWKFAIDIKDGFEISERQPGAGISVQMGAQLGQVHGGHGETYCMGMPTEAGE